LTGLAFPRRALSKRPLPGSNPATSAIEARMPLFGVPVNSSTLALSFAR
jgi:hypothetical protein